MDGMYAGFAGAKTGHRGAPLGWCRPGRIRRPSMLTSPAPLGRRYPRMLFAIRSKQAVEARQVEVMRGKANSKLVPHVGFFSTTLFQGRNAEITVIIWHVLKWPASGPVPN